MKISEMQIKIHKIFLGLEIIPFQLVVLFLLLINAFLVCYLCQYNCMDGDRLAICIYCSAITTLILFLRGLVHTKAS